MKIFNKEAAIYSAYFFFACLVVQAILVTLLRPRDGDFIATETFSGIYTFIGGAVRTRSTSRIGGRVVFCGFSYLGPENSCGSKLQNKYVVARLAICNSLFGDQHVLLSAIANDGDEVSYTRDQLMHIWLFDSIGESITTSIFLVLMIFYPMAYLVNTRGKRT